MGKKDPRVDAYIARSAEFARPILRHIRELVHKGCPDIVEEMKWNFPHFNYGGIFCGMAAFKAHCTFGFWNRAMNIGKNREAMGQFGRIKDLSDLPKDAVFLGYIREARRLADEGIKLGPIRRKLKPLPVPPKLSAALRRKAGAAARFQALSPSQRREYSEWIGEARTDVTRDKRIGIAVGQIAEGKSLNWKYQKPARSASARA